MMGFSYGKSTGFAVPRLGFDNPYSQLWGCGYLLGSLTLYVNKEI